jgi:hypothetical protein
LNSNLALAQTAHDNPSFRSRSRVKTSFASRTSRNNGK